MSWLAFVVAAVALAATALAAAAALRLSSAVTFLLGAYLLGSAELVVLGEVLSLVRAVGAAGYAVGQALLLAAALAAWHARGRPRPPLPRVPPLAAWRDHPILAALALVVGGAALYQLFVVLATPPNNWDSMTYHLPRAVYWLQHGGLQWIPNAHTQRENAYQPGSELEILWTFAFTHRDRVAAVPQWVAELATLVAVFGCARRLGFAPPAAAFAALATATLTEIALQSVTTQNDLLTASFVAAAACLVLGRTPLEVALAGLAVGLALGTKGTAVFALPILLALALVRLPRRTLALMAAASVVAFAAVGLYGYAFNLVETGHLLGDPAATKDFKPERITASGTISTAARIVYRFADLPGFHAKTAVVEAIGEAGKAVFDGLGIPANPPEATSVRFDFAVGQEPNEDLSFFGPLGALLVLPLALGFVVAGLVRRTSWPRFVLAVSLPAYAVEIALAYSYNVWIGRFMITPVVLVMPLAAWLYRSRVLAAAAALLGALTLGLAHAYNHAKPTGLQGDAIWSLTRPRAQATTRPPMGQVIEAVEHYVRADGRLGTVIGPDDWEYPLYGPHLRRRLVPLREGPDLLAEAERRNLHWLVLSGNARRPEPRETWFRLDFHDSGWTMFLRPEEL